MVPVPRNKQALGRQRLIRVSSAAGALQCEGGNKPAVLTGWNIGRAMMILVVFMSLYVFYILLYSGAQVPHASPRSLAAGLSRYLRAASTLLPWCNGCRPGLRRFSNTFYNPFISIK